MNISLRFASVVLLISCAGTTGAQEGSGRLEFVGKTTADGLDMVTSVEISDDGRFLYAAAWQAATITVFERNANTGELTLVQELTDRDNLYGSAAIRLSPGGRLAAATAFRSQSVVLFQRDAETGKLTKLDVAKNNVDGVTGLAWAIDVSFSPDSKFVYAIDSRGPSTAFGVRAGSVTAFRITSDNELEFIEAGQDSDFADIRGVVMMPDGKTMAVVSSNAGTLVVLNRDPTTGKTTNRQVVRDESGGVHGLAGAMGITTSADGKHVYVSSGRFGGDDAVSVYRFSKEGDLTLVQELVNDRGELKNFRGGNEITVSPDGKNVYAVASLSSSLSCFARDQESGELSFLETVLDDNARLKAVAGLCVSPDGKFVYAAAEQGRAISIFRRK